MARPAKFSHEAILDAAREAVLLHGKEATVGQVCELAGAPIGSVYHRFPTRDHLFVELWIRSIRRFQDGLLVAASLPDVGEALATCALHIPRYCRDHPAEARALTLYRWQVLVEEAPAELVEDVGGLNDAVDAASRELCRRRFGRATRRNQEILTTAIRQAPYGLVRPYVGSDIPRWLDDAVLASSTAILALGDRSADQAGSRPN